MLSHFFISEEILVNSANRNAVGGVAAWDPAAGALRAAAGLAEERGIFLGHDAHAALDVRVAADRDGLTQLLAMVVSRAVLDADPGAQIALVAAREEGDRVRYEVHGAAQVASEGALGKLARRLGVGVCEGPPPAVEVALAESAPEALPPATAVPADGSSARRSVPAGKRAVVLCVEDNPVHRRLLADVLARRPQVEAVFAEDAAAGIRLALKHRPNLVLLDLQLADLSGLVMLERLRADPLTAATRVVILSADVLPGREEAVLRAGADVFLAKPVDVGELLATVDRLLAP